LEGASKWVILTEILRSFLTLVNAGNNFQRLNSWTI